MERQSIATYISTDDLQPYLNSMIAPICCIVNDESIKGTDVGTQRSLETEVLDFIQKRAGTTEYFNAYNRVRQRILDVRQERKHQRIMRAMNDPEAHARRRIQKNEMKSRKRQLKAKEFAKTKIRLTTKKRRID
ncbi:MAG: hypothetical protein J3Q66DRAFT_363030 [Benniella sp.]|nr:MAG: hypothetical protein J3Q66DRAFT_363030 [Benniella sp.]